MGKKKFDIFISYRRDSGAQYARILQLELEKRGYSVFLDYDELTDGIFGDNIKNAIFEAPIFMMVLSPHYLDRCKNDGDWVREEITLAIALQKHFIPVNPDNLFDGIPDGIPSNIDRAVRINQHSTVNFGQFLKATIDELVEKRVSKHVVRHRKHVVLYTTILVCLLIALFGIGTYITKEGVIHDMINATGTDIHNPLDSLFNVVQERRLEETDIKSLNKQDLSLLRNSIYARHGYRFERDDLFDYFSKFSWYCPTTSSTSAAYDTMSDIEKYNVRFIKEHE